MTTHKALYESKEDVLKAAKLNAALAHRDKETEHALWVACFCPECWTAMEGHVGWDIEREGHFWFECPECGLKVALLGTNWYHTGLWGWSFDWNKKVTGLSEIHYEDLYAPISILIAMPQEMMEAVGKLNKPRTEQEHRGDWNPDEDYEQMLKSLKEAK